MTLQLEIVTQERRVYAGEVDSVNIPASEGRMGILPNHTAVLTALAFGEIVIKVDGEEEYFAIGGGFAEVQPDKVIILADSAEAADEIDIQRAEEARAAARKAMEEGVPEDPVRYQQIEAALRRAQIRVDVGRKRSNRRRSGLPMGGNNDS